MNAQAPAEKLLLNLPEVMETTNLGRTFILAATYDGKLASLKAGRRRLWPAWAVKAWIAALAAPTGESNDPK